MSILVNEYELTREALDKALDDAFTAVYAKRKIIRHEDSFSEKRRCINDDQITELVGRGMKVAEIARHLGMTYQGVRDAVKRLGLDANVRRYK